MNYSAVTEDVLNKILAIQFAVSWAGESGDEPRLSWWETEVMSEYGGYDNLKRLTPHSALWLGFKTIREAARRVDAELRQKAKQQVFTLYHLGFELDEQIDQHLNECIHNKVDITKVLDHVSWLKDPVRQEWNCEVFTKWLQEATAEKIATQQESVGRRLVGDMPEDVMDCVYKLLKGLLPIEENYSLPHYRANQ